MIIKSSGNTPIGRNVHYFHERIGTEHAFQAAINAEYVNADCFEATVPVQVPARTLLSQLV